MPNFVEVAAVTTGKKQRVPEHWLDHPTIGPKFKTLPSQKQEAERTPEPSENWTVKQLREHAEVTGVDLTGATTKADILAALASPSDDV